MACSLFGDGAAAAVVGAAGPRDEVIFALGPAATCVEPVTGPMMGWAVGDDGFEMTLAAEIPSTIGAAIAGFVDRLAPRDEVGAWCVHPGGPATLATAERALGLGPNALDVSRAVLRDIGNVSSATIPFVLERAAAGIAEGVRGVAVGFGPGLTLEGFAFQRGAVACRRIETAPDAVGAAV